MHIWKIEKKKPEEKKEEKNTTLRSTCIFHEVGLEGPQGAKVIDLEGA